MTTLSAHEELDRLHAQSARVLANALAGIGVAKLRGDLDRVGVLQERLGKDLGALMAAADLLGRRRLLLELRAQGITLPKPEGSQRVSFAAKVPFVEAAIAILQRYPVLAEGWIATRDAWEARGFALARSTSVTITKKVRETFVRSLRGGLGEEEAVTRIQMQLREGNDSITRAYADTVFRTVTSSAYTEGRAAQARRPAVQRAASGWRYVVTNDVDLRSNHKAGEDLIAHVDDPVWSLHAPPNGYNCRCALEIVPTPEMVALGLSHPGGAVARFVQAPPGFMPDPGFTGRRALIP